MKNYKKVLDKWLPVLNSKSCNDFGKFAEYAEAHSNYENCSMPGIQFPVETYFSPLQTISKGQEEKNPIVDASKSTLELSINALIQLQPSFWNVMFVINSKLTPSTHTLEIDINHDLMNSISDEDYVEYMNNLIVSKVVFKINYDIRDIKVENDVENYLIIFSTNCLIKSINVINLGTGEPKIVVKYGYCLKAIKK